MKLNYYYLKEKIALLALAFFSTALQGQVTTLTFSYTGATQTFVIPSCVSTITIEARGAAGGTGQSSSNPGLGGTARGVITATAGQILYINVGGMGTVTAGGFNGGGAGGISLTDAGAGGGGASDIRLAANTFTNRILVAGGGGGSGGNGYGGPYNAYGGHGGGGSAFTSSTGVGGGGGSGCASGNAGGESGGTATGYGSGGGGGGNTGGGSGGGQPSASTGGYGCTGTLGIGGDGGGNSYICGGAANGQNGGGGGGGGYYGGGGGMTGTGGCNGGGGGGSSFASTAYFSSITFTPGLVTTNGVVTMTYALNGAGVSVSPNTGTICSGTSVTLTAGSVSSYTWLPVGTFAGSNSTLVVDSPTSSVVYTVQGTNSIGCISNTIIPVMVNPGVPSLSVANTASASGGICPTKTVMLTASGALSYTWTGGSPTPTNGVAFAPPTASSYTVTGGNACGTSTAVTSVSVHPLPNVTPSASSPSVCSGTTLMLTGVGNATNYAWTGSTPTATFNNAQAFTPPATTTNYTVIGTSALSCTAAATITVPVVLTPSLAPVSGPGLICIGKSSTLTAAGPASYTWTGGSAVGNSSVYIVTPSSPGITTYTVLRANSTCTTSAIVSVVTNSLPTPFAIANQTLVCALSPATLAVAGAQSYTWMSPGNPPSTPAFTFGIGNANPIVNPPVNTIYTVAASDGTCVNTTTVAVATNPIPTLAITPSASMICQGQTVGLTVTGGINYTWTSTSSTSTMSNASFTDSPTQSTAYNVIGDNSFGCTSGANQVIIVNNNPTLTAQVVSNKTLVCNAGASTITASGANTYTWSSGISTGSGSMVVVTSTNTSSGPVVYTVTGTNTLTGCTSSKTSTIIVFIPTLAVSGTPSTCPGGNITLSASGGNANTYSWTAPGSATSQIGFSSITTSISGPGVFTVSAMTTSLVVVCKSTQTVAVDLYALPTISATAQRTVICNKEHVVLSATGGTAYSWSNGQVTPTINVNPTSNTTYTVNGVDNNGCSGSGTISIKVSGCAGITEQSAANAGLNIYPNPNNGEFFIESNSDAKLTLVNELGQIVRTLILSGSNNYKVQLNDVAQGVYFLTGQKDGVNISEKIIVTR